MSTEKLLVALPPHEKSEVSVEKIMWSVVLALLPTTLAGIFFYGVRALLVTGVAVGASVLVEHLVVRYLFKRTTTSVTDGSFPVDMTTWPVPGAARFSLNLDDVTAATPLGLVSEAGQGGLASLAGELPSYMDLFLGNIGGCIGEASALAVIIGGLYLVSKGYIAWPVPLAYLGTLAITTGVAWLIDPSTYVDPLYHILAGGAMLGAWFMVTDMTTSPMSVKGRILFAAIAGVLAGLIRLFGGFPEGVSYSILIMNAFVPVIDRHLKPRKFGYGKRAGWNREGAAS